MNAAIERKWADGLETEARLTNWAFDALAFIYSVGADSPSCPHKDAARLICEFADLRLALETR